MLRMLIGPTSTPISFLDAISELPDHPTHSTFSNADMAANLRHVCGQTYPKLN